MSMRSAASCAQPLHDRVAPRGALTTRGACVTSAVRFNEEPGVAMAGFISLNQECAPGDRLGQRSEVAGEDTIGAERRHNLAYAGHEFLEARRRFQRPPKLNPLHRTHQFNGDDVRDVVHDATEFCGRAHCHGHEIFLPGARGIESTLAG